MHTNRELPKAQIIDLFRTAKPVERNLKGPQITIRGDNNLINFGTSGGLKVKSIGEAVDPPAGPARSAQWPQQILDAIRVKAMETQRSSEEICEIAEHSLGRPVVTLEKLSARELARVYEAICSAEQQE
jgi:hypothetical protein